MVYENQETCIEHKRRAHDNEVSTQNDDFRKRRKKICQFDVFYSKTTRQDFHETSK